MSAHLSGSVSARAHGERERFLRSHSRRARAENAHAHERERELYSPTLDRYRDWTRTDTFPPTIFKRLTETVETVSLLYNTRRNQHTKTNARDMTYFPRNQVVTYHNKYQTMGPDFGQPWLFLSMQQSVSPAMCA